jgi:hypothetical protein
MQQLAQGCLHKMHTQLTDPVSYRLSLGGTDIVLNDYLGKAIAIDYLGSINCSHCGRLTKKSFSQGYCYPCFKKLAQCDSCIVSPEKCHYHEGSCREPDWAEAHCMRDHFVYLANSSGVKVGITRGTQIPTRWIDQGAVQAMPIARVKTRLQSGLVEVILKRHVADRTHWQRMLKGQIEMLDLPAVWQDLQRQCGAELLELQQSQGLQAIALLEQQEVVELSYPVLQYPEKVKAHNLDKQARVEGTLMGIKGQYLMLDTGVINIRKFTSYHVEFQAEA